MRYRWIFLAICVLALFCEHAALHCQTDTIGGVINRYTRLRYIECTGNSAINVADPYGFHAGDRIMIVQMKGAEALIATPSDRKQQRLQVDKLK